MFRNQGILSPSYIVDGMRVILRGYVSLYERDGQYQLYAQEIRPDGMGELFVAFHRLKDQLADEGLFEQEQKRPIPILPARIGIVTSPTGAALRDILTILGRVKGFKIILIPVPVQGRHAPEEIARAIQLAGTESLVDILIVTRGGGSLEELWAYNAEEVVRAIRRSRVPVITAVGHETDTSLADMAADLRLPTPTAAAEFLVNKHNEAARRVQQLAARVALRLVQVLNASHYRLDWLEQRVISHVPFVLSMKRQQVANLAAKVAALSPLDTLARGYAVCRNADGLVIKDWTQVEQGQDVEVILFRGKLNCRVERSGPDG